nr:hypothetical protein [Mycoplasmopsis bovis]
MPSLNLDGLYLVEVFLDKVQLYAPSSSKLMCGVNFFLPVLSSVSLPKESLALLPLTTYSSFSVKNLLISWTVLPKWRAKSATWYLYFPALLVFSKLIPCL